MGLVSLIKSEETLFAIRVSLQCPDFFFYEETVNSFHVSLNYKKSLAVNATKTHDGYRL